MKKYIVPSNVYMVKLALYPKQEQYNPEVNLEYLLVQYDERLKGFPPVVVNGKTVQIIRAEA